MTQKEEVKAREKEEEVSRDAVVCVCVFVCVLLNNMYALPWINEKKREEEEEENKVYVEISQEQQLAKNDQR